MIIRTRNAAGNWEQMTCDTCGKNDWAVGEKYEATPEGESYPIPAKTGFECSCGEPGPVVKDEDWRDEE